MAQLANQAVSPFSPPFVTLKLVKSEKQDLSRTDASLSVLITHERTREHLGKRKL